MKKRPIVSIIVSVYNTEKYLQECLDSLITQTLQNIEIICVDDGSTDSSYVILQEYASKDDRFIILKQANQGAACARNRGVSIAKGKYLLFLDSDDVFVEELCEKAVQKAEEYQADIVIYKALFLDTNTNKKIVMNDSIGNLSIYKDQTFSARNLPDNIFNFFLVQAWNKLFRRDFILNNAIQFQNIKRSNDLFFSNKALALANKIILLDEKLLYYRVGIKDNLQSGNDKTPLEFYKALLKLKLFLDKATLYKLVQKSFLKLALEVIFYNLNSVRTKESFNYIVYKLRKDGFYALGIADYKNLRQLNLTGYLQYKAVCFSANRYLLKTLYIIHKLWQYYRLTGLENTLKKII